MGKTIIRIDFFIQSGIFLLFAFVVSFQPNKIIGSLSLAAIIAGGWQTISALYWFLFHDHPVKKRYLKWGLSYFLYWGMLHMLQRFSVFEGFNISDQSVLVPLLFLIPVTVLIVSYFNYTLKEYRYVVNSPKSFWDL